MKESKQEERTIKFVRIFCLWIVLTSHIQSMLTPSLTDAELLNLMPKNTILIFE